MTDLEKFDFSTGGMNADNLREFFTHCYRHNVSDIHLQSGQPIVLDHYGRKVIATQFNMPPSKLIHLIDEIYSPDVKSMVQGGRSIDRALQLEGDHNNRFGLARGERLRFRTNFIQATIGSLSTAMGVTLRVIPSAIPSLEDMGLPADLRRSLLPRKGLGLVCGQTGSGKSTLLASIYQHYGETHPHSKLVTYEDPVEYLFGGPQWILKPQQSEINRDVPSFAEGLRASLRQAPTLIGVGEIRDLETARIALQAAETGHLVLSTLHVSRAVEAVQRLTLLFPEEERDLLKQILSRELVGVFGQRLVPPVAGTVPVLVAEFFTNEGFAAKCVEEGDVPQLADWIERAPGGSARSLTRAFLEELGAGRISEETALAHAPDASAIRRSLRGLR